MTLNSYRDPSLRDRRTVFARHPLSTALGTVFGVFLLLVPIGLSVRHTDDVVVRTAALPGGVADAGVLIESVPTASTSTAPAPPTTVADVAAAVEDSATSARTVTEETGPATTARPAVKKPKSVTTVPRPALTVARAKPTTTSPTTTTTTTAKPATTTTAKPTTTTATTTTTIPPPVVYSPAQSEAAIRKVWPDDLEAKAVAIATRESTLHNVAHTSCCYGLFQIKFSVHQQWLATMGVARAEQLYDPTVNATVAYQLYLRSGWGPWGG
jgi:hypothetical protein